MDQIIVINKEYEALREFIMTLDDQFHHTGETIYKDRNEVKVFDDIKGISINVKRFCEPNIINRIVYRHFRLPKATRSYHNAFRLQSMGISTPAPIGYVIYQNRWRITHSYLITLQMPLSRSMYEFGQSDLEGREAIVRDFAAFSYKLHSNGIKHRDYSPGNILFDIKENGHYQFALVDINRMSFDQQMTLKERCQSFCRLWGREDFIRVLSEAYAHCSSADPDLVYSYIKKAHDKYWKKRYKPF